MREGWEVKKLGDVCSYDKTKYIGNHLPYVGLEHIQSNTGKFLGSFDGITVKSSTFHFSDKHLLYGRLRPYLNKVLIPDFEGHCSTEIFPINMGEKVLREFLYYWFTSENTVNKINATWTGARMPRANMNEVINFLLPIPPLPEQTKIVITLDKAFKHIDQAKENLEKNLHNAKELFQSKLNEVFSQRGEGWEEKRLGDVCEVLNGYAFKSKDVVETSNTQLLRMGNLYQNTLDLARKPVFYPDIFSNEYSDYLLKENDLIMSLTGTVDKTDYGYTVRIKSTKVNLLLNQRIMKIDVLDNDILDSKYLHYFLLSPDFLKSLYATANGTRQANLSSKTILTLNIPVPTLLIQKKIVKELDKLNELSNNLQTHYQQKLNNLEELKKSILQKAFRGELA